MIKTFAALKERFLGLYGEGDVRTFFSPGRVNLIGEHTDYNGGYVFPCALDFGTYAVAKARKDAKVRFYSENFPDLGVIEANIHSLENDPAHNWANYPKGVIWSFMQDGLTIPYGFDVVFYGDIPTASGLSSSASIELCTAVIVNGLFDLDADMVHMVKLCQKAENEFVGMNCGIMDQFAIGMGKKEKAILLDCNTVKYSYAPVKLHDYSLVIVNTNKPRKLSDSKYNERRAECEGALSDLQKKLPISALCELTPEQFEENKALISNPVWVKRAKHAVYENFRTIKAVKYLEEGDLDAFGKALNDSHISLRDDYEVTGKELDTLVSLAWAEEGTLGARMTGAGFGGCTVNLVKTDKVDDFIKNVGKGYEKEIGYAPSFYPVHIGDGSREIV